MSDITEDEFHQRVGQLSRVHPEDYDVVRPIMNRLLRKAKWRDESPPKDGWGSDTTDRMRDR